MNDNAWSIYAQQSFALQWAKSERTKRGSTKRSSRQRQLMKPSQVTVSWPGWHAAGIKSWW